MYARNVLFCCCCLFSRQFHFRIKDVAKSLKHCLNIGPLCHKLSHVMWAVSWENLSSSFATRFVWHKPAFSASEASYNLEILDIESIGTVLSMEQITKMLIRLRGWSESSLWAQWVAKDPSLLHADREDSDQTGQMPRLIWFFAGCTCHFVGFVMLRLIC